ncbi:hypothetical protein [Nostoc sp. LEGE 12450]|nr:hypothetical protein [Nostoc sp. LEGE 12450]
MQINTMAEIQLAIEGKDVMPTAGYAYAATEALFFWQFLVYLVTMQ